MAWARRDAGPADLQRPARQLAASWPLKGAGGPARSRLVELLAHTELRIYEALSRDVEHLARAVNGIRIMIAAAP